MKARPNDPSARSAKSIKHIRKPQQLSNWLVKRITKRGDKSEIQTAIIKSLDLAVSVTLDLGVLPFVDPSTTADLTDCFIPRCDPDRTWANQLTAACFMEVVGPLAFYEKDVPLYFVLPVLLEYAGLASDVEVSQRGREVRVFSTEPVHGAIIDVTIRLDKDALEAERQWRLGEMFPAFWSFSQEAAADALKEFERETLKLLRTGKSK